MVIRLSTSLILQVISQLASVSVHHARFLLFAVAELLWKVDREIFLFEQ